MVYTRTTMEANTPASVGAVVTPLPDWLTATATEPAPIRPSASSKALAIVQFEVVFPRMLEMVASGSTLANALRDQPIQIDAGAFLRWIKKDSQRHELYKEAKEIRTEAWAGKIIDHATAADTAEDVQRSKLVVDTYKWLMAADNRRTYGASQHIEINGTVSISAALAAANNRLATQPLDVIDMENGDA